MFVINGSIDYSEFCNQLQLILSQRTLLLQVAYDVYDSNGDDKITELDLFKLFYMFSQEADTLGTSFEQVFYEDVCEVVALQKKLAKAKHRQLLEANNDDEKFVKRMLQWRNMQLLDRNFDKKKQRILWPLYQAQHFNRFLEPGSASAAPANDDARGEFGERQPAKKNRKMKLGFNYELFKSLESVKRINDMKTLRAAGKMP